MGLGGIIAFLTELSIRRETLGAYQSQIARSERTAALYEQLVQQMGKLEGTAQAAVAAQLPIVLDALKSSYVLEGIAPKS